MKFTSKLILSFAITAAAYTGNCQPVIQFVLSSYSVAESAGVATLYVQRTGDTNGVVTIDYATMDGTATNGLKYGLVSGKLTFEAGITNRGIMVPILNESFVEGTRNFRVTLSNPTGGAVLGTRRNMPVIITDNDYGIQFQLWTNSVAEDAGVTVLRVVRDDDGTLPATVDLFTTDLTARKGVDYTGVTTNLSFAPQERLKLVAIPILNNLLKQPNRTFLATLANPVGASLGPDKNCTVTMVDNDQGFHFEFPSYTVDEDAGAAQLTVLRGTDDTNSAVTVDCATADLTATNGVDYRGITNSTLTFAPGEKVQTVAVPILNNGIKQASRRFKVSLSNPTGGAVLGYASTTISILDNDPGVGFEHAFYTNRWGNAAGMEVTVLRGNDWALGPITVDYATSNLTAIAGQDYKETFGTVEFRTNETVKTITIPLLQARAADGAKYFRLTLSNPTGGATLGKSSALLYISGSYFQVAPRFDTALKIEAHGALHKLTWAGGGLLQRADKPDGPWQSLTNAQSPFTVQSPIPTTFYRVARPRPVNLYVPSSYQGQTPMPLVFLLHGYYWTGAMQEDMMRFQPLAESRGFLYCYPDSLTDLDNNEYWNGTDACCDLWSTGVDDVGYLFSLIEEISRRFAVDRKRIYITGHSNGGYLSYRMACEHADVIAAIAAVSGSTFLDPSKCAPSQPVNILQIHGTDDEWQFYWGGANNWDVANLPPFPSAPQSVQTWAEYNGASGPVTDPAPTLDLTTQVSGLETVVTRFTNAPPGGAVELWTMHGASHWPTPLSAQFAPLVIDWLLAHPKP